MVFYFNQKWERKTERIVPIAQYFSTVRKLNLIKEPEIKAAIA
jgi:hypothetical protein